MNKDFYTCREVAELTGLRTPAIQEAVRKGRIKAEKFNGTYLITKEAFAEYLQNRAKNKTKNEEPLNHTRGRG